MADQLKEAIQAKIRKYQMLLELAEDPETREMLKSLVQGNGNGQHLPSEPKSTETTVTAPSKPKRPYGQLKLTVFEVLRSAKQPVTTDVIVEEMRRRHFEFKSDKPAIAVNEALNTLREKDQAKVFKTEGVRNFWVATSPAQETLH